MKFICAFVLIGFVALVQADGLTEEDKAEMQQFEDACQDESHVDKDILKKTHDGHVADDDNLKHFFVCFFKKLEVMTAEGKIDEDHLKEKLTKKLGEELATKIVETCNKDEGDENKTAIELAKCYNKLVPKSH